MKIPKVDLLGVGVSRLDDATFLSAVHEAIRSRPITVAAVNVHTWCEARRFPEYAAALASADLTWADGVPIAWLSRRLGTPVGPRLRGIHLMELLLSEGLSHYFYGSTPEILADLERVVRARFPKARIAGSRSPAFTRKPMELSAEDAAAIESAAPDVLWVALGAPKQELWMKLNKGKLRVPVTAGVGAAFEMLAGRIPQAPTLLQGLGLEWLWRLARDPGRLWRRYLSTNGHFVSAVLAHALGFRSPSSH